MGYRYPLTVAGIVISVVGLIAWRANEDAKIGRPYEPPRAGDAERRALAEEYEERTQGPCGRSVEMLNRYGETRYMCERDVPLWLRDGWIVRYPDAGVP